MLMRIVKMEFQEEGVEKFLSVFDRYKEKIASAAGCMEVNLLQDYFQKNIFYTYSRWDSDKSLNLYRESDLFKEIWPQTKVLFNKPAQAWSLIEKH